MNKTLLTIALLSSFSGLALANQAGDFVIRVGATMVAPNKDRTAVFLDGADSGLEVLVGNSTQLGLNFIYFFNSNWAVELLAATPFDHDIKLHASNDTTLLADTKQLPPTLSALYYFDTNGAFKPYIGAGINYTIFFDNSFTSTYSGAGFSHLKLDDSFGFAAQIGADYQLNEHWTVNFSARYISISTDATFKVADSINGLASVDVNPYVYSLMLGYKF